MNYLGLRYKLHNLIFHRGIKLCIQPGSDSNSKSPSTEKSMTKNDKQNGIFLNTNSELLLAQHNKRLIHLTTLLRVNLHLFMK